MSFSFNLLSGVIFIRTFEFFVCLFCFIFLTESMCCNFSCLSGDDGSTCIPITSNNVEIVASQDSSINSKARGSNKVRNQIISYNLAALVKRTNEKFGDSQYFWLWLLFLSEPVSVMTQHGVLFFFVFSFLQVISYSIYLKISELIFMSTIVSYSLFLTFHKMSYHYQMIWFSHNLRKWYDGKWNCTVIKTQII